IASVTVYVVAAALVLTQFEAVRNLGMSLLASAGIAGIVVGLAAQKTISSLLAGIQLSITQPIRIGDSIVVEGEFGTVEEIHLTYVVVRVWDLRRLIVPITRFLDAPFQNWTKVSPEIMGTVELFADYSVPIDQVRAELGRFCEAHPAWDKKVCNLQVTAVSERTVTLRALVSSENAGKSSELRNAVREQLVKFLQQLDGGRYLPQVRLAPTPEGSGESKSDSVRNVATAG
ncbi:MAG TPA: mechanosensitive ion channel protein MscS, partial [Myxococcales bacterium]|nr:mechanosensitive ion channel protein MscS [Myxococcales bacterium]